MLVNPPYGERLGEGDALKALYGQLGAVLKERFNGWQAGVFTGNPALGRELKIEARRRHRLFNGPIEAQLLRFEIAPGHTRASSGRGGCRRWSRRGATRPAPRCSRTGCARISTRSASGRAGAGQLLPGLRRRHARVLLRGRPVRQRRALRLRPGVRGAAHRAGGTRAHAARGGRGGAARGARPRPRADLVPDPRRRKGLDQYTKVGSEQEFHEVAEGGPGLVNFDDYLDTGLFLDHRPIRRGCGSSRPGRRFLNLFGYTGSASVYAAAGGARSTTTVDMSRTYLDWTRRNLELNGFGAGTLKLHIPSPKGQTASCQPSASVLCQ